MNDIHLSISKEDVRSTTEATLLYRTGIAFGNIRKRYTFQVAADAAVANDEFDEKKAARLRAARHRNAVVGTPRTTINPFWLVNHSDQDNPSLVTEVDLP